MFRKRLIKLFHRQTGFTLIEVLLSFGLMALIGVGLLQAIDTNARASGIVDQHVTADTLATGYIEAIRQSPYANNYTSATANITIPLQYSVVVQTYGTDDYVSNWDNIVWVGPPSSNQTLQKIIVSVSQGGKLITTICTLRTRR
ncbi:MAG: prepilin-type N-terminal cleavage/methylation domain-containing protein [Chloroflexota bacterium]